jgi:hypothetical protein
MANGSSDNVRRYAAEHYIAPARRKGEQIVRIHSGTINKQLIGRDLLPQNRFPIICNSLKSDRFLEENELELIETQGPPSGLSSTVTYVYRLKSASPTSSAPPTVNEPSPFQALRGILKTTYKKLGGAEAFHKSERASWDR